MNVTVMLSAACISITFVLVLYLFYWNRLVAYIIGLIFRLLYWKQCDSSFWVEIGSIHFSLLAGRIIFKDVRYHSSNQTIKVVKGQFTWAYWIRNPTTQRDFTEARIDSESKNSSACIRRCRIQLSLQGMEWFLYNRTASYEYMVSQISPDVEIFGVPESPSTYNPGHRTSFSPVNRGPFSFILLVWSRITSGIRKILSAIKRQLPNLDARSLFPVGIEIIQGAVICGNLSTPNLLLLEFQGAEGTFGAVESRSKLDLYKQVLSLSFRQVLARLVENDNYRGTLIDNGQLIFKRVTPHLSSSYLSFSAFTKLWDRLGLYSLIHNTARNIFSHRKAFPVGSTVRPRRISSTVRSKESSPEPDSFPVEYAVERKILETPMLDLSYYADVAGDVPFSQDRARSVGLEPFDIGNGDTAPEWGFDIIIRGGFLRCGPWADRQRVELQRVFFPAAYQDIRPTQFLKPGDRRLSTCMKIFVELRDETNLRIPFREASKDWQQEVRVDHLHLLKREAAIIQVMAGDSSTISYIIPMVAGPTGYESLIEIHLDTVSVSSSLNDIRVLSAESCRFSGILRSPLKWNAEREWSFSLSLRQPVLYLLRDHINMFTDLVKDWISGPPTDLDRFVPMLYVVQLEMHHYKTFLYANDHNIIDKPLINEENALFIFRGPSFRYQIQIPARTFRPETNTLPFFFEAPDVLLNLSLPRWSTHALHAPKEGSNLCKAAFIRLNASFHFSSKVRQDFVDQLKLQVSARDVKCNVFGWAIRYIMVLRDNYFGTFTHFSTLSEYLDKRRKGLPVGDPIMEKYRPGMMNVLQVELEMSITNGSLVLPAGLPGYEAVNQVNDDIGASIILTIPEAQVYLRLHDYFMEMSLNIDTASGYLELSNSDRQSIPNFGHRRSREVILIDGVDITANRLFGPQPRTPTYVCFWTVAIGHIKAFLSTTAGRVLIAARNAFRLNFLDPLNAPAAEYLQAIDPDVTFFKTSITSLDIIWRAGIAALEISCPQGLTVGTNDLVSARVFLRENQDNRSWMEAAVVSGDIQLDAYSFPKRPCRRPTQAEFFQSQDKLTKRTLWISRSFGPGQDARRSFLPNSCDSDDVDRCRHINGLYLPQTQPPPLAFCEDVVGPFTPDVIGGSRTPGLHPRSLFSQSSVSEDGDGMSENDRDARLAKTRLTALTTSTMNDDNASITSGDESDTEDLTDICTSDDGTSDVYLDAPTHDYSALLILYSLPARHYKAPWLGHLLQWDRTPFIPVQGSTSFWDRYNEDILQQKIRPPDHNRDCSSIMKSPHMSSAQVKTPSLATPSVLLRIECRRILILNATPLLIPAATIFVDDIKTNPSSPELCLDAVMNTHLQGLLDTEMSMQNIVLEVSVSRAHIYVLHKLFSDSEVANSPSAGPVMFEIPKRGVTIINEVTLKSFRLSWTAKNRSSSSIIDIIASSSFDAMSLKVAIDLGPHSGQRNHDMTSNILKLRICRFQSEFASGKLSFTCYTILTELCHLASEFLSDNFHQLVQEQRDLHAISQNLQVNNTTTRGDIIRKILMLSRGKTIVDPLSTIQPSYLVQGGRPYQLRTDTTFRFFFHLRNCVYHLDSSERSVITKEQITGVDDTNTAHLIESRLSSLGLDADRSKITDLMMPGLKKPTDALQTEPFQPIRSLYARSERIDVVIVDPSGKSSSQIFLTEWIISACLRAMDLVPSPSHSQTTLSQVPSFDRERRNVRFLLVSVFVTDVNLAVFPHLVTFAQQGLRVIRQRHKSNDHKVAFLPPVRKIASNVAETFAIHVTSSISHFRIQAAAENLVFEFQALDTRLASTILGSRNISIVSDEVFLLARSPDGARQTDQDTLASLNFTRVKAITLISQDQPSNMTVRASVTAENLRLDVPRSALRLYRFIEEWRADYLPGVDATLQALLSEIHKPPDTESSDLHYNPSRSPVFQLHGSVASLGIHLQVMHGTWLSWNASRSVAYLRSSSSTLSQRHHRYFGLQFASQLFSISPSPITLRDTALGVGMKLNLPRLSLAGQYDGSCTETMALVDFFHIKVKPSHWDTLLVVQQKFGQDFNDLMTLVEETRHQSRSLLFSEATAPKPWKMVASMKMRGFRVGLEGLSSIVYLECRDIHGGIHQDNIRTWNIQLSELGLSLASRAFMDSRKDFSNRNRLAFVVIDFAISAENQWGPVPRDDTLSVSVTKIHAVLQPNSIREAGDYFNQIQSEILERKEQRVLELAAFKEKAKSVMKTFEINVKDAATEHTRRTWIGRYIFNLSIRDVGAAFPLTLDQNLPVPQLGSENSIPVRAFLFSIKSLDFNTFRDEEGQAVMRGFSFQFVSRFRQSVPEDFLGENHQTWNRLVYPEVIARLRSRLTGTSRRIRIWANISGFVLDIDSTIPDQVSSLIEVYREGEIQVAKWTAVSRNLPAFDTGSQIEDIYRRHSISITSNVSASLTFLSGKVRVYHGSASVPSKKLRSSTYNVYGRSDDHVLDAGAEIFKLPVVSVWGEYRTARTTHSDLIFKSTVHSSHNSLTPVLLRFLNELVGNVNVHIQKMSSGQVKAPSHNPHGDGETMGNKIASIRISFSLRIDQSRLELTCQPDVNVIARLHWDHGGFVVNISPGARLVTFTGCVGGLTVGLKHGFLSEDCMRLDARDLSFSMAFTGMDLKTASPMSVSIIVDTQFSGGVRFSRLQDVLCFKAVWLDRFPLFATQDGIRDKTETKSMLTPYSGRSTHTLTAVLLRIRQITLDVELGHSIGAVKVDFRDGLVRTRLTASYSQLSLHVVEISSVAKGNLSGQIHLPNFIFRTIRRRKSNSLDVSEHPKMLELTMTSGALDIFLDCDNQRLLRYHASPLRVEIFDDWSISSRNRQLGEQSLLLSFLVEGKEIVAAVTISTFPKLLSHANKFKANLEAQREGASRESKTFRVAQSPKPDHPLSDVAHALLHSARNRLKETEVYRIYMIRQHLRFQLGILRLAVFPRTMLDLEMAQFLGRDIHARLDRSAEFDGRQPLTELNLSISSVIISKFGQLDHLRAASSPSLDCPTWLTQVLESAVEAIIVGLPSMNISMTGQHEVVHSIRSLVYDFQSQFVRQEGMTDQDIYITLNMGLYSWLTVLRRNLSREMDYVRGLGRHSVTSLTDHAISSQQKRDSFGEKGLQHFSDPPVPEGGANHDVRLEAITEKAAPNVDNNYQQSFIPPEGSNSPHASATTEPISRESKTPPRAAIAVENIPGMSRIKYKPRHRDIERLTMRQLGEATPDVMHPFFMKKAGFSLEDYFPQYVHEYATVLLEQIMEQQSTAYAKRVYRHYPQSSKEADLEKNVIAALKAVPLISMRRFATRSRRFMDAYSKGLNGKQAAWASKKYRGHRVLPEDIMQTLDNVNI